ncbi:HNH endonuclease signature motif containing protein [Corynebacterium felinum]|uniref:HNH nuclease domain-containing protein n=1 Tax=Corynebacterium felinum TaxID=131318 RepID=A0ABU2BD92_9CORY|nr:HNH endonuclease signature motif containing protein [Corynebacterium felinum]MDF5821836.1 HNH endonuclease signature motif containing protein [Corynebacterium felinum]MDR7355354.1 hypothetical protein [Corynebacterium felinum]WJY94706.1 hypothetical protein CFELI_05390 [Corynebacterium felinum]
MEPCYSCLNPSHEVSALTAEVNRMNFLRWEPLSHDLLDKDVDAYSRLLAARTGVSARMACNYVMAFHTLRQFPLVLGLQRQMWLLDLPRISLVFNHLCSVDERHYEVIDACLYHFLCPTKYDQELPSAREIIKHVNAILADLFGVDNLDGVVAREPKGVRLSDVSEGRSSLEITTDSVTGRAMWAALKSVAKRFSVSLEEAARKIFFDGRDIDVKVVVHAHRLEGTDDLYVPGAGFLSTEDRSRWVPIQRSMDGVEDKVSCAYHTPDDMKAFMDMRDGQCRGPSCSRRVEDTDRDHWHNFTGANTQVSNLVSLCRRCHNLKSAGTLSYALRADGAVSWTLPDGSTSTNLAVPRSRLFGQTFAQRIESRAENLRTFVQLLRSHALESHPPDE